MGRSKQETFSELLVLLASRAYLVRKSVRCCIWNPRCLFFGSLNSCLVTYLLHISYSLGKSGIRTFGSETQLDFHVGGDQCGILSARL